MVLNLPSSPVGKTLRLETRERRQIDNLVTAEPDDAAIGQYLSFRKPFVERWQQRKPACGGYNCFGMVFAARRTTIDRQADIEMILADDGYRELAPHEAEWPGDLLFYYLDGGNCLIHVAVVVRPASGKTGKPTLVLSKWDAGKGEDLHEVTDTFWHQQASHSVTIKRLTDRPHTSPVLLTA